MGLLHKLLLLLIMNILNLKQEKINREILNSKLFLGEANSKRRKRKRKNQRAVSADAPMLPNINNKARSLMNLHNNEAGRRVSVACS